MQFLRLIQHAFYQYCPRSFPISDPSFSFHLFSSHYSIQCRRNVSVLNRLISALPADGAIFRSVFQNATILFVRIPTLHH